MSIHSLQCAQNYKLEKLLRTNCYVSLPSWPPLIRIDYMFVYFLDFSSIGMSSVLSDDEAEEASRTLNGIVLICNYIISHPSVVVQRPENVQLVIQVKTKVFYKLDG